MRPSFLPRLVNGPLFDPVVYVRLMNTRRALMFDCGRFRNLSDRELLAVETVCISHTHMDHFMGFDDLLRTILHRQAPLSIYGPEGIITKTLSKLQSYTWNLTSGYALEILIHEVHSGQIRVARTRADNGFEISEEECLPRIGMNIASSPRYCLDAAVMDHKGIPCMGYVLREPFHINVRKDVLARQGYRAGEWIGRLKECILQSRLDETIPVETSAGIDDIPVRELKEELIIETKGQTIAFITDISLSQENMQGIDALAGGEADIIFIEAFYLGELEADASLKGHLTAGQAGAIARRFHARRIHPMHISPRYHDRIDDIYAEIGIMQNGTFIT